MTDFQYKQVVLMAFSKAEAAIKDAITDEEEKKRGVEAINRAVLELLGRNLHDISGGE